jgi:AraC-like DNA-binding protein
MALFMVNKGHFLPSAPKPPPLALERVIYTPPASYGLDIEVLTFDTLRKRILENRFRQAHQINFYLMMLITEGRSFPVVDYLPMECDTGTLLLLSPNQALQFDLHEGCNGWVVIFKAEFLDPSTEDAGGRIMLSNTLQGVPAKLSLASEAQEIVSTSMQQMHADTLAAAGKAMLNAMLRFELQALMLRLAILGEQMADHEPHPTELSRFRRFEQLLEEKFAQQHTVADYAAELGCTVKSLTRATQASVNMGAKEYIAARINLEAKRLLTHTRMPVALIAEYLGFDEPTNFVKFFKRNSGVAPNVFRKQHYSIYN